MTLRVTTVCLGNICRSPIAAAVLASELADLDVEVDSMGTGHWHIGQDADPRALDALARAGYAWITVPGRPVPQRCPEPIWSWQWTRQTSTTFNRWASTTQC